MKQTQRQTKTQGDKQEGEGRNESECKLNTYFGKLVTHANPFPHHLHMPQHTQSGSPSSCIIVLRCNGVGGLLGSSLISKSSAVNYFVSSVSIFIYVLYVAVGCTESTGFLLLN